MAAVRLCALTYSGQSFAAADASSRACRRSLLPFSSPASPASSQAACFSSLRADVAVGAVLKVHEGRPNIEDQIRSNQVQLVINTPIGRQAAHDGKYLRRAALDYAVPTVTTLAGARAAVEAISALQQQPRLSIHALQDVHAMQR